MEKCDASSRPSELLSRHVRARARLNLNAVGARPSLVLTTPVPFYTTSHGTMSDIFEDSGQTFWIQGSFLGTWRVHRRSSRPSP